MGDQLDKNVSEKSKADVFFLLVFFSLMSIIILQTLWMAYKLTGLSFEGANWFFIILNDSTTVGKIAGYRWSDELFQLPAIFASKLAPQYFPTLPLYILSYTYTLHPLFSILICYTILSKSNQKYYLFFPILSFAIPVVSTLAFNVGVAAGAISFFWPLLFILKFKNIGQPKYLIIYLIFLALVTFNYELSVLLILLLIPFVATEIDKTPQYKFAKFSALSFTILAISFQILRISLESYNSGSQKNVFMSDFFPINIADTAFFGQFTLLATIEIFIALSVYLLSRRNFSNFLIIFNLIASIGYMIYANSRIYLMDSRVNRTTVIPAAFFLGLCFLICHFSKRQYINLKTFIFLTKLSLPLLVCSIFYLTKINQRWENYTQSLIKITGQNQGCLYYKNINSANDHIFTSLLLQKTKQPNSIIFTNVPNCGKFPSDNFNPCEEYVAADSYKNVCQIVDIKQNIFNLTKTKQKAIVSGEYFEKF